MNSISSRTDSKQNPPARGWPWLLIPVLSIGIGIPLARYGVAALWPSLDATWGAIAVNAAAVGLVAATVALILAGLSLASSRLEPRGKHFVWTIIVTITMLVFAVPLCLFMMWGRQPEANLVAGLLSLLTAIWLVYLGTCTSKGSGPGNDPVR